MESLTELLQKSIFERTTFEHLKFFIHKCSTYDTRYKGKFDYEIKCTYIYLCDGGKEKQAKLVIERYKDRLSQGNISFPS